MDFKSISLKSFFDRNYDQKLVLPNFQRRYVWEVKKQKNLLASFILNLPVGNLLILKGSSNDFAARDLCFKNEVEINSGECEYLLDGQQRLSTLKAIFSDLYRKTDNWKNAWDNLPYKLRCRFSLKAIVDPNSDIDLFNYKTLKFNKENVLDKEPSQIKDLIFREQIQVKDSNLKKWFHPAFNITTEEETPKEKRERKKRNDIANFAAELGLIPLYELYYKENNDKKKSKATKLHKMVLDRIGTKRVHDLKEELKEQKDKVVELLEDVEPDILEIINEIENGDLFAKNKLQEAWMKLGINWAKEVSDFLEGLLNNQMAQIILPAKEISRAFAIFEVINQGGTPLNEYDLIVAKAARDKSFPNLTERILENLKTKSNLNSSITKYLKSKNTPKNLELKFMNTIDDSEPSKQFKNQFLNLLSIFSHTKYGDTFSDNDRQQLKVRVEHTKRDKVLSLTCNQINSNFSETIKALKRALIFLQIRCGVVKTSDVNYQLMILPIAYALKDNKVWTNSSQLNKIEYWYWSSLFGGAYLYNQNTVANSDISDLYLWLTQNNTRAEEKFKERAINILNAPKYSDKATLLHSDKENLPNQAIRTGILQYILSQQPRDFLKKELILNAWDAAKKKEFTFEGKTYDLILNNHHIQPLSTATKIGQTTKEIRDNFHILNSPLNRTYISSASNSTIRDKSPEDYFKYVSESSKHGHCIATPISEKYIKRQAETDEGHYTRILAERYERLKGKIIEELDNLIS